MAGDMILGYDGQEGSEAALRTATASPPRSSVRSSSCSATGRRRSEATSRTWRGRCAAVGERITAEALDAVRRWTPRSTAEVELVDDRPAEAILRAADEHDALGDRGGCGRPRADHRGAAGSVTYNVVHRSTRPVVVVPAPERA